MQFSRVLISSSWSEARSASSETRLAARPAQRLVARSAVRSVARSEARSAVTSIERWAARSQAKMSSKISTSNFLLDGVVSNLNLRVVIYTEKCLLCLRFFGFEPEASPGEGLRLCFFIFCLSLFFLLSFGLRSMCRGTCIWLKSSSGLEVLIRSHWSFVQWGMTAFTNSIFKLSTQSEYTKDIATWMALILSSASICSSQSLFSKVGSFLNGLLPILRQLPSPQQPNVFFKKPTGVDWVKDCNMCQRECLIGNQLPIQLKKNLQEQERSTGLGTQKWQKHKESRDRMGR